MIFVNDNCPQNSWELIEELCHKDIKVIGIELSRNFGQMKAILAGLDHSTGDWVIVMDCDLQDRPEEIPALYQKAMEGYDIVVARRAKRKDNLLKILMAGLFYRIYRFATDGTYDGAVSNFSIISRKVVDSYCRLRECHLPSELNAAYLYAQMEEIDKIQSDRMRSWNLYYENLKPLEEAEKIKLPFIPEGCVHNAHMFYIKARDLEERTKLIDFLKKNGIGSVFHYIPLHSAPAGIKYGRFNGEDRYTTKESERLLRLPMYYGLSEDAVMYVCGKVCEFYSDIQ